MNSTILLILIVPNTFTSYRRNRDNGTIRDICNDYSAEFDSR